MFLRIFSLSLSLQCGLCQLQSSSYWHGMLLLQLTRLLPFLHCCPQLVWLGLVRQGKAACLPAFPFSVNSGITTTTIIIVIEFNKKTIFLSSPSPSLLRLVLEHCCRTIIRIHTLNCTFPSLAVPIPSLLSHINTNSNNNNREEDGDFV